MRAAAAERSQPQVGKRGSVVEPRFHERWRGFDRRR
jgi:hypothetical protein